MFQEMLQGGGGGEFDVNPQTPSELNNNFTKKGYYVVIEGSFSVPTNRNSPIFLTGLPKPKAEISNAGNMSTSGASSSITITTNGEAKANAYNAFSEGYTWTYSISYLPE